VIGHIDGNGNGSRVVVLVADGEAALATSFGREAHQPLVAGPWCAFHNHAAVFLCMPDRRAAALVRS
jgi:hypothetical protein